MDDTRLMNACIVSGGFATVQPNSVLSINAPEAYPLEDFSAEAVRAGIAEAQKVASGNGSEQDIAEAKIELEVREAVHAASQRRNTNIPLPDSRDPCHLCQINDYRNITLVQLFYLSLAQSPNN